MLKQKLNYNFKKISLGVLLAAGSFGLLGTSCCKEEEPVKPLPPVEKTDVTVYYDIAAINLCDDIRRYWKEELSIARLDSLEKLPTTGQIIPKLYCDDARGPPPKYLTNMLNHFDTIAPRVKFINRDTLFMPDALLEDSIRAQVRNILVIRAMKPGISK